MFWESPHASVKSENLTEPKELARFMAFSLGCSTPSRSFHSEGGCLMYLNVLITKYLHEETLTLVLV